MTAGELRELLAAYPDDCEVQAYDADAVDYMPVTGVVQYATILELQTDE